MENKLPKVFEGKVDRNAGNNEEVFYSEKNTNNKEVINKEPTKNINQRLNDIFNSPNYVYKADVEIKTKDKTIVKRIIGRNTNQLITIENELIPISDIIDIKIK